MNPMLEMSGRIAARVIITAGVVYIGARLNKLTTTAVEKFETEQIMARRARAERRTKVDAMSPEELKEWLADQSLEELAETEKVLVAVKARAEATAAEAEAKAATQKAADAQAAAQKVAPDTKTTPDAKAA